MSRSVVSVVRWPVVLVVRVLFIIVGLPVLFILEPLWKIRFGLVYTNRIGHLAGNTDILLRKQQIGDTDPKTINILAGVNPANRQLYEMFKRHLPIYESKGLTRILFYLRPLIRRTRFWEPMEWNDPDYRIFNEGKATLVFTDEEEKRGRLFLSGLGIGEDDWFVCMHDRDPAYLDAYMPTEKELWRARDFRNCSIDNYMKAAEYITSKGGFVIRMGAIVDKPLSGGRNSKIIDYATTHRSDFLDIYLPAKCRFFLGSDSGLFVVSAIFDVPIALANNPFILLSPFRRDDLFILKITKEKKSSKKLTFDEALSLGFYNNRAENPFFDEHEMIENSPDEIFELTQEMLESLEGQKSSRLDTSVRDYYWQKYISEIPHSELSGHLGARFASKYKNLIRT